MAYSIYKVTDLAAGEITAVRVYDGGVTMTDSLPKKFIFVKASDLAITTDAPTVDIEFEYKDKF